VPELTQQELVDSEDMRNAVALMGGKLHNKYRRFVPPDDIAQVLWEHILRHPKWMTEYLDREELADKRRGFAAICTSLWRAGERYCRKEKAALSGYSTADEAFYTRATVEELILMQVNGYSYTNQVDDRVRVKTSPVSGYNFETSIADLDTAMKRLDPDERLLLMQAFGEGWSERDLAQHYDASQSSISRRLTNASKKLIRHLGGDSPWQ
jgi:RNA polymerase sigma factor (sigma-70 family)